MSEKKIAVYPGSFDPITNGHIDLVYRAQKLFDVLIIAVTQNQSKAAFFNVDERLELIGDIFKRSANIKVMSFPNLLVDFVQEQNANIIIRGLRAVSDFEYEFQLSGMNRQLAPKVETLFMTPAEQYANISSSLVKEIAVLSGDVSKFVPASVAAAFMAKLQ